MINHIIINDINDINNLAVCKNLPHVKNRGVSVKPKYLV